MSRHAVLALLLAATGCVEQSDGSLALGETDQYIVGGSDVAAGDWPDAVVVLGNKGSCSGTLIAPDVVLTAGHCSKIEPTQIIANTIDYAHAGGVRVNVAKTIAYPNWESTYDVSVIVLASPITNVTPRNVATSCTFNKFKKETQVHLVGFGATDMQGTAANSHLREAMAAVTDPTCSGGNGCNSRVAPGGEFVAGGTGNADSCFGDSGGPVYLDTEMGTVLVGAVSRGVDNSSTPCGGGGIYVRTDKIIDWLESTAERTIAKDDCVGGSTEDGGTGSDSDGNSGEQYAGTDVGCSAGGGAGAGTIALLALLALRRRR
ncbi:MAG: trypsin-like serine protease [Kofleriaceae bacterium]|nr:trypsin-like serine protease [Kofleriaceae bacterium]